MMTLLELHMTATVTSLIHILETGKVLRKIGPSILVNVAWFAEFILYTPR
jgi:hypothetical protein